MVAEIIDQKKPEIAALCRTHGVRTLWVFGSATTDAWNPETSDIDFLVDLGEYDAHVHRRFFGLLHDLEELTGRPVDLLTVHSVDNLYLRDDIDATKELLYGQANANACSPMMADCDIDRYPRTAR